MALRQDIRFCTTPDGVRLAMALYGSGPPLVRVATWLTHVERDPVSTHTRHWIDELSRGRTYVTYDMRGCGLSSRRVPQVSAEAWVQDLETRPDVTQAASHRVRQRQRALSVRLAKQGLARGKDAVRVRSSHRLRQHNGNGSEQSMGQLNRRPRASAPNIEPPAAPLPEDSLTSLLG